MVTPNYPPEYETKAQKLSVSVDLLIEGDNIAKDFYAKQKDEEFNLKMED